MRITKVALAFFSIGFLAGSFERAAGLGHVEGLRAGHDRQVDANAAIVRSTAGSIAVLASFGGGLPAELLARPLNPPAVPDAVAGAIPDTTQAMLADRTFVRYAVPQESDDWHLIPVPPLNPDLRRHAFGARRMLSEPNRAAISPMPAPSWMSTAPVELPPEAVMPPGRDTPIAGSQKSASPAFIMPFERGRVTSLFHQGRYHPAIDLAGPLGTPVQATTRRQRVTFAGWRGGYGNAVITRDDSGRTHLYGHLQRIFARVGSMLDQGQKLGALGSTGHSTGPHVHYEMRTSSGAHIDPVTLLFGRRVGRGYAWNGARSVTPTRVAARAQPRPR